MSQAKVVENLETHAYVL